MKTQMNHPKNLDEAVNYSGSTTPNQDTTEDTLSTLDISPVIVPLMAATPCPPLQKGDDRSRAVIRIPLVPAESARHLMNKYVAYRREKL